MRTSELQSTEIHHEHGPIFSRVISPYSSVALGVFSLEMEGIGIAVSVKDWHIYNRLGRLCMSSLSVIHYTIRTPSMIFFASCLCLYCSNGMGRGLRPEESVRRGLTLVVTPSFSPIEVSSQPLFLLNISHEISVDYESSFLEVWRFLEVPYLLLIG